MSKSTNQLSPSGEIQDQTAAQESPKPPPRIARPRLPPEFHRVNPFSVALYLAHALAFFAIPVYFADIVVHLDAPLTLRIPVSIALGLIAGHGLHLLTFVGHEGLHTDRKSVV